MQSLARATAKCCCIPSISRGTNRKGRLIFYGWLVVVHSKCFPIVLDRFVIALEMANEIHSFNTTRYVVPKEQFCKFFLHQLYFCNNNSSPTIVDGE
jgi:hypothetical protein